MNFKLLDVRTNSEYEEQHLDGAVNLPVQDLHANTPSAQEVLNQIAKSASVKVYCASGGRSALAKQILAARGFEGVEDLGGMSSAQIYLNSLRGK